MLNNLKSISKISALPDVSWNLNEKYDKHHQLVQPNLFIFKTL